MDITLNLPDSPEFRELILRKLDAEATEAKFTALRTEREYLEFIAQTDFARASNFRNRTHDLVCEVNDGSVENAVDVLNRWARQGKEPITIRLTSPGGQITNGLALFDNIRMHISSGITITTVAMGEAGSMAAVLLQAGTKRVIGQNASFFIHNLSSKVEHAQISVAGWEEQADNARKLNNRLINVLAERSNLKASEINRRIRDKGWTLDAETSIRYGFADEILQTSYSVK